MIEMDVKEIINHFNYNVAHFSMPYCDETKVEYCLSKIFQYFLGNTDWNLHTTRRKTASDEEEGRRRRPRNEEN